MFIAVIRRNDNQPILINIDDVSCIIKNKSDNSAIFIFRDDSHIDTTDNYNTVIKRLITNELYIQ